MLSILFSVLAVAAPLAQATPAQAAPTQAAAAPFDAEARIQAAIATVRPVAYRSPQVDWDALTVEMRRQTKDARDDIDMLPAWAVLTQGLGDGHSFVQPTTEATAAWRNRYGARPVVENTRPQKALTSIYRNRQAVEHHGVAIGHGRKAEVITVPSVTGLGEPAKIYAADLFKAVAQPSPNTCGYILDLRGNTGGNVWPMLLGLSPLLGDGPQGRSIDASGKAEDYADLKTGAVVVQAAEARGLTMMQLADWRPLPRLASAPVALLLDGATASSGEGVAVAFQGRAQTRSFGETTYGVASSNEGFELADGTNLVITVAMMADRNNRTYPQGVTPDVAIAADGEPVVDAARQWLASQPACRPH